MAPRVQHRAAESDRAGLFSFTGDASAAARPRRQKSLAELADEKMRADIASMAKNQEIMMRLVAEIHAFVVLGKSPAAIGANAQIKRACDELLKGNVVPMQVLSRAGERR